MKELDAVLHRVSQLRNLHSYREREKELIRAVCAGPEEGLKALLGDLGDANPWSVPAANLVLKGLERLGQKLGRPPDLRIDPPVNNDKKRSREAAEKRARIVQSWDEEGTLRDADLETILQQSGLWLPGYAFVAWVIKDGVTEDGEPYPQLINLDPFGTYPAHSVGGGQPSDLAYVYQVSLRDLAEKYPQHRAALLGQRAPGGGIILDPGTFPTTTGFGGSSGWSSPSGAGVEVAEYYDQTHCHVVVPEKRLILESYPNPLRSAQFIVGKRVSFSRPVGQYDHSFGLQGTMAQFNIMAALALKDGIHAETNVVGELISGQYRKGRRAVNYFTPGTQISKPSTQVPYQLFQELSRLDQQFRITAGYSPIDDAISPAAQATGQGIDRLTAGVDMEVKQYLTTFRRMLELKDRKQLEWMDTHPSRNKTLHIVGSRRGEPFADTYIPAKDINKAYRTTRNYGAMAGLDDQNKISALMLLRSGDNPLLDTRSAMEELDLGGRSVSQVEKRLQHEKADRVTWAMLLARAEQGDPAAALAVIEIRNGGDPDEVFKKFFTPQEPEMSPEEAAMIAPPQMGPPPGPPPLPAEVMAMLGGGGMPGGPPGMPMPAGAPA